VGGHLTDAIFFSSQFNWMGDPSSRLLRKGIEPGIETSHHEKVFQRERGRGLKKQDETRGRDAPSVPPLRCSIPVTLLPLQSIVQILLRSGPKDRKKRSLQGKNAKRKEKKKRAREERSAVEV